VVSNRPVSGIKATSTCATQRWRAASSKCARAGRAGRRAAPSRASSSPSSWTASSRRRSGDSRGSRPRPSRTMWTSTATWRSSSAREAPSTSSLRSSRRQEVPGLHHLARRVPGGPLGGAQEVAPADIHHHGPYPPVPSQARGDPGQRGQGCGCRLAPGDQGGSRGSGAAPGRGG